MPAPVIQFEIRRLAKAAAQAVQTACTRRGIGGDLGYLQKLRLVHDGRTTAGQLLTAEDRHGRA